MLVELLVLLRNQEGCVFLPRQACYSSAFVHSPRTQISLCSWFLAAQPSLAFLLGKVLQIFVLGLEFFTWHSPKQLLQDPFIDTQPHIHDVKVFGLTYSVALLLLWGLSFCICCFWIRTLGYLNVPVPNLRKKSERSLIAYLRCSVSA